MQHHKTYMSINFQQNRVCRSVKTVHTNLFANKMYARRTRDVRVVFSRTRMRSSTSGRMNKSNYITEKIM